MSQSDGGEVPEFLKCTVISCSNYIEKELNPHNKEYVFFPFPSDRAITKIWKEKCGVAAHHEVRNSKVCSEHFKLCDFSDGTRTALKEDAVPKENLGWMFGMPEVKLFETPKFESVKEAVDTNDRLVQRLEKLTAQQKPLREKIDLYEKKIGNVKNEIGRLKNLIAKIPVRRKNGKVEANLISKVFSQAQINMLVGKRKVVWSYDDMAMAFTLRHIGNKECYLYLKDTLNMPLPSLSNAMSCIVYGCSNNNFATADPSVHYYVFPKHPVIAQQWVDACGWQADQIDINIARICSIHFDENSYTTEIKMIDYITCYTKVLKYDAVPTLYLPSTTQIVIKESETTPPEELREMIVFAVPTEENIEPVAKEYIELQVQPAAPDVDMERYKHVKTKEQLAAVESSNKSLREKVMVMEENLKNLKLILAKQMQTYKEKDLELSKTHHEYLKTKRSFLSLHDQRMLLSRVFSESQIKILSGKKKIYWTDDDMAVGYTVRHLSNKRCYTYLTKKLNIPLPAVSSIKRWMTLKIPVKKSLNATSDDKKDDEDESE
ncbi:THAP and/or Tnp P element domain containing protein [Asbolus verrucosus]|uniref:THAP and/or Tnp P element domain containing protein n=1 Tax=Asbolus verrucosus TaxID=1661398 RepID=A0A482VFM0_ASBVE|nr:THAP and/or Tnp P element domain containing protein [Asbolus verrucosus]